MDRIQDLTDKVIAMYKMHGAPRVFTVAVSGIDAAGKGFITGRLQKELEKKGYTTAYINTDPWQHPLPVRLNRENPAQTIYDKIFRWNDLFERLVFPLQENGSIYLEIAGIHSHADIYFPLIYDYNKIDILLAEGILLLKREYLSYYDCTIWIDCSFETGLQRALARNVEKLEQEQLISDYLTYYYPAQRLHLEKDDPHHSADIVFDNP